MDKNSLVLFSFLKNFDQENTYHKTESEIIKLIICNFSQKNILNLLNEYFFRFCIIVDENKTREIIFNKCRYELKFLKTEDSEDEIPLDEFLIRESLITPQSKMCLEENIVTLSLKPSVSFSDKKLISEYESTGEITSLTTDNLNYNYFLYNKERNFYSKDTTNIYRWDYSPLLDLINFFIS